MDCLICFGEITFLLTFPQHHLSIMAALSGDVQGGVYSNGVILTDPCILSFDTQFGETDLGPKGISSFFSKIAATSIASLTGCSPGIAYSIFNQP
jgi:hypothetical protein